MIVLVRGARGEDSGEPLASRCRIHSNTNAPIYLPVPVRLDVCGLPIALSLICKVPVLVPVAVGVKTTSIWHLDLGAKLVEHVVEETVKSPVAETAMLVSGTLCLLSRVNVLAALVVPTFWAAYVAGAGVSVA